MVEARDLQQNLENENKKGVQWKRQTAELTGNPPTTKESLRNCHRQMEPKESDDSQSHGILGRKGQSEKAKEVCIKCM